MMHRILYAEEAARRIASLDKAVRERVGRAIVLLRASRIVETPDGAVG